MIAKLHYISQQSENFSQLLAIENALEAGCKWIQLRMKDTSEEELLKIAVEASKLCNKYKAKLIVNDYPYVAQQVNAQGVHLGPGDMPLKEARAILGSEAIIGSTANTFQEVVQRADEGADYIGLGPYCFTITKKKLSPILGLEGYAAILEQAKLAGICLPIIAVGGIKLSDIPLLIPTGIYGVAISGAITYAADRRFVVENINQILQTTSIL